jgi:hypothetical protein
MTFNGVQIHEVIIDQHYKINHPEITDEIIFQLVLLLNGDYIEPEKIESSFKYYVEDSLILNSRPYRLIFITERFKQYIGVVNAFRVKEKKNGLSF